MLIGRGTILLGILCVLFVAAAFGQEPSDSHIITVTEKIDVVGLNNSVKTLNRNVEKLTENMEKLTKNVEKLTESVNSLTTRVAVLEERTQGTAKTVHVILASFIGPLVVAILASIAVYFITRSRGNVGKIASASNTQDSVSEAASTQSAQEKQSETTLTPTLPSRLPDGKKDLEYLLKSDPRATKAKV